MRESIRRRTVAITLSAFTALAIVGLAALGMPLLRADPAAAPGAVPSSSRPTLYACLDEPSADHPGDDPCRRIAADLSRRRALTDARRDGMLSTITSITGALRRHTRSECQPNAGPCSQVILPADVTDVRVQLTEAGYPDAIVRPYRPTDPAPAGSVVYAVKVGDVCLLGYLPDDRSGQLRAMGPYPDGSCLTR